MRDFRKAATDALFKDIGDAVDDVDFEPIKDTTLDFLKHTRDILQSVDWNMFRAAGKRVMEAGKDSISEIHEKVIFCKGAGGEWFAISFAKKIEDLQKN